MRQSRQVQPFPASNARKLFCGTCRFEGTSGRGVSRITSIPSLPGSATSRAAAVASSLDVNRTRATGNAVVLAARHHAAAVFAVTEQLGNFRRCCVKRSRDRLADWVNSERSSNALGSSADSPKRGLRLVKCPFKQLKEPEATLAHKSVDKHPVSRVH